MLWRSSRQWRGVALLYKGIKRRLRNMGTLCNACKRGHVLWIYFDHSPYFTPARRETPKSGLTLSPQQQVIGEKNTGRVDYTIKNLEELICITEGKQSDTPMGFAQNFVQCESAMQVNKMKRKALRERGLRLCLWNRYNGHGIWMVFPARVRAHSWFCLRRLPCKRVRIRKNYCVKMWRRWWRSSLGYWWIRYIGLEKEPKGLKKYT